MSYVLIQMVNLLALFIFSGIFFMYIVHYFHPVAGDLIIPDWLGILSLIIMIPSLIIVYESPATG